MRTPTQHANKHCSRVSLLAVALVLTCTVLAPAARAADSLACGVPLTRHLDAGATDAYAFSIAADATVVVDAVDVSGSIGLIKLGAAGVGDTCSGSLTLAQPTSTTVTVSDCVDNDAGDYTIVANVVADAPQNCGRPLPCGIAPYVHNLTVAGQVDAYTFSGSQGDRVTIKATDVSGEIGSLSLRLFDPTGTPVNSSEACADGVDIELASTGLYTVLVSACLLPHTGRYGIAFQSPACPAGPDITYFGVALADGSQQPPAAYDNDGRPIYQTNSAGFFVVIEAQPGQDGTAPGYEAFEYDPTDPSVLPDLQVVLARPLGDGSAALCDKNGVPSVFPFAFADTQSVADAINDFGCRISDGAGNPRGVSNDDACTYFTDGSYHYVEKSSAVQFCTQVLPRTLRFPPGKTAIKARVRDTQGVVGAERAIIVSVDASQCPGDCNGDGEVTVDELIRAINIALGTDGSTLDICPDADSNDDGVVTVDEIVQAVNVALGSCPQ